MALDPTIPSRQHDYPGLPRLAEHTVYRRRETVFLVFSGLFLATLAMLNILGITRFIKLFELDLDADPGTPAVVFAIAVGVLPYPLTFLATDFISELFGRARANAVVWVGLIVNLWVLGVLYLGAELPGFSPLDPVTGYPPQPEWNAQQQVFEETGWTLFQLRHLAFGAVTASMAAYLTAQFIDVQLFHFWKHVTRGKHLWLRNNASTMVSQLVDTTAVILITHFYARGLPVTDQQPLLPQILAFIATGYAFKFVAAALDTIPFVALAPRLARYLRLPPPTHHPAPPAAAAVEAGVG